MAHKKDICDQFYYVMLLENNFHQRGAMELENQIHCWKLDGIEQGMNEFVEHRSVFTKILSILKKGAKKRSTPKFGMEKNPYCRIHSDIKKFPKSEKIRKDGI
jgi:hypothetical protein